MAAHGAGRLTQSHGFEVAPDPLKEVDVNGHSVRDSSSRSFVWSTGYRSQFAASGIPGGRRPPRPQPRQAPHGLQVCRRGSRLSGSAAVLRFLAIKEASMIPVRFVYSTVAVLAIWGTACSSSTSSSSGSGGTHGTGGVPSQGGTMASGGSGSGGAPGTGGMPGQGGSGGATQPGLGGSGSGGVGTGGRLGTGGTAAAASGGSGALGGASGTGSGGSSGNPGVDAGVAQSAGCGKTRTLQNGPITITFSGASRKYILRVPDGYDSSLAYRLVFAFAESGSSAQSVADRNYFTMATLDTTKKTIFAAPDAVGSAGSWSKTDVDFTDAILAALEA